MSLQPVRASRPQMYSREFKLEAVRQAALGEKPKAQIARVLRFDPYTAYQQDNELDAS